MRRRDLAGLGAGLVGLVGLPARARPVSASERKFLFVYCSGGWDTTWLFTPKQGVSGIDTDGAGEAAEVNGLTFVDGDDRPSVRQFFEAHGDRTAFLNGFEVASIAHDRCRQLIFTGYGDKQADDWPTILAASSGLVAPHLVLSGPAYAARHGSAVVRVGSGGQLPALLDGSVFSQADTSLRSPRGASAQADYLRARMTGRDDPVMAAYLQALDDAETLAATEGLDLTADSSFQVCNGDPVGEGSVILDAFSLGISRCGVIEYAGWCANSWDSHSLIEMQGWHYEELFWALNLLMEDVIDRGLEDEVCIVVISEMGREPTLNGTGGKGHWTWTSAMLVGAGVAGGQVVGGLDDELIGEEVQGSRIDARHLGATLLAMGDVDPAEYVDVDPIEALLA